MVAEINKLDVLTAFINAIDVLNPILKRHHSRTAIMSYHIGVELGLDEERLAYLVTSALLHDIGALTVKDAETLVKLDVVDPEPHAVLGASMLGNYKPFQEISHIIRYHHINYRNWLDMEEEVPEEAFILHLADRIDVLTTPKDISLNSKERVTEQIKVLNGELFAPWAVDAFMNIKDREDLWFDLDYLSSVDILNKINRKELKIGNGLDEMEELAYTISRVIDYKCPFTASHSVGVAKVAELLSEHLGIDKNRTQQIKLAAYLHDIGKIAVPSELLYKQDSLTKKEYNVVKAHPYYTREILKGVKGLEDVVKWASSHHERLDGSGYPSKPDPASMSIEIEILTYADVFTALSEQRPYRDSLPLDEVLRIMETEFVEIIGSHVLPILKQYGQEIQKELKQIQQYSFDHYPKSKR